MHGWVIYNGHLATDAFLQFPRAIQEAGRRNNIPITLQANDQIPYQLDGQGISIKTDDLPDFVVFNDKDIALARTFEMLGIPLYNSAETIANCDNKVIMYQYLAKQKVPIPKTIIAPKVFSGINEFHRARYIQLAEQLSYPMVIKEGHGSFGEQVYLVKNHDEMLSLVETIKDRPFVFQEYIQSSYGRDIRLFVVGSKVVASLKRTSSHDFRANVYQGSTIEAYQPTEQEQALAIQASHAVGAHYAGVDLLFGADHQPIVCEVNTNAHIGNILQHTGINMADVIIHEIMTQQTD
ncbi:RimK family alpha-L-glutamate ligase [Gracilibacillus halophilus YIM-C55.5]|uniref:RimK family alpha-L-glutamate ligase n=1 Tax=Gracilibacillus halophilus YIM-C55.5 TaxID=1308866 RepID=N4WUB6_9BACI|nr:RimK family alpha-L-glutamate ligase [Gracilibacillus halophilus]ENH97945.1 RimK family alpha-L-glutamate ligase [Gracilibacillus halophilus YIM-C55.5]